MGIMKKKMETTIMGLYEGLYSDYREYIGVTLGIMEKQMETTIGFRV